MDVRGTSAWRGGRHSRIERLRTGWPFVSGQKRIRCLGLNVQPLDSTPTIPSATILGLRAAGAGGLDQFNDRA